MDQIEHPVFGDVDVDEDEELHWSDEVDFSDTAVEVALRIEDTSAGVEHLLDSAAPFITRIEALDALVRETLRGEHDDDHASTVLDYQRLVGSAPPDLATFVAGLQLRRVTLTPETEEECACFEYAADDSSLGERLVVCFDDHREIAGMSVSS